MFVPPRCPNRRCPNYRRPEGRWWRRRGSYRPNCRPHPVRRFDCKSCRRTFSRQTFRADRWDKKPWLNSRLAALLSSGNGLRQSARVLKMHRNALMAKAHKLGQQLMHAHRNAVRRLLLRNPTFVLDELETFEGCRRTRPLTLPILIERETWFILGADADLLPARGRLAPRFRRVLEADQKRHGKRRNRSSRVVGRMLRLGARVSSGRVTLICDEKRTYPILAKRAFGAERVRIEQTSSRLPRTPFNPLFPINLTNAMARDLSGRLRRRSWLASKKRLRLRVALSFFIGFRNYIRPRFNRDEKKARRTPAQMLGLCRSPMTFSQLLSWRQDWGPRSVSLVG